MDIISVPIFFDKTAYSSSNHIINKIQKVLIETETIWDFIALPINSYEHAKTINEKFVGFVYELKNTPAYIALIYENNQVPTIVLKVLINRSEQTAKTKKFTINQIEFILDDMMKKTSDMMSV